MWYKIYQKNWLYIRLASTIAILYLWKYSFVFRTKNNLNKKNILDKNTRILIRLSGTEPLVRLLVEGKDLKQVQYQAKILETDIRNALGQ